MSRREFALEVKNRVATVTLNLIADAPVPAVRISKLSLRHGLNKDPDTNLEFETHLQHYAFRTPRPQTADRRISPPRRKERKMT